MSKTFRLISHRFHTPDLERMCYRIDAPKMLIEIGSEAGRGPKERVRNSADIPCLQIVSEELLKNLGITLAGVFGVVLLMVGNLQVSLWVFTCILFTLIGIAGGIRFAGLTIEIVTSILMILSVGLAVDYSTHIAHKFMITYSASKDGRFSFDCIVECN